MKKSWLLFFVVLMMLIFGFMMAQEKETQEKHLKPALLVIDIQNQYLPMMSADDTTLAIPRINWLIILFRNKGLPIIRVYHDEPGEAPELGDPAFEFPSHIQISEKDPKIIKNYGDAFHKTDLAKKLKDMGVNTVFLCGLSATGCVLATHFGASENQFKSFMVKDALISWNKDHTNYIEEIFNTVTLSTLKFMIDYLGE